MKLSLKTFLLNGFREYNLSLLASLIIHLLLFSIPKESSLVKTPQPAINFHPTTIKIINIKNPLKHNVTKTAKKKHIKRKEYAKNKIKNNHKPIYESSQKKINQTYQKVLTKEFNQSIVQNVLPIYPRIALKQGWSGRVLLHILVDSIGVVKNVKVVRPSLYASLNKSAVVAASQWLFKKSETGGPYQIEKEIVFKIKNH